MTAACPSEQNADGARDSSGDGSDDPGSLVSTGPEHANSPDELGDEHMHRLRPRRSQQRDRADDDEDEPAPPAKTGKAGMFRSLAIRNYRLYFFGNLIGQIGIWMNRVAQDWLILQLTNNSASALGIATALQFAPNLLLSMWAGAMADRYDKRRLLMGVQVMIGTVGVALGVLATAHLATVIHVYLACFLIGVAASMDSPLRAAFVSELVGPDHVVNAVGLNTLGFNGARIIGPALAGVLIAAVDSGPVIIAAGLAYSGVLTGLLKMRTEELHRIPPPPRTKGAVRAGLRYVQRRQDLKFVIGMVAVLATFGMNFQMTLAVIAKTVFHRGADSYGLLTTSLALGAITGAAAAARRTSMPRQRQLIGLAFGFSVTEIVLAFISNYTLLAILLVPQGYFMLAFINAAMATIQITTPAPIRGRVMGIYTVGFLGGTPFVSPLLGWSADHWGGTAPLWLGGSVCLIAVTGFGIALMRSSDVYMRFRLTPVPHPHLVNPAVPTDLEGVSYNLIDTWQVLATGAKQTAKATAKATARPAVKAMRGTKKLARRVTTRPRSVRRR